jgi:hypothetical protein
MSLYSGLAHGRVYLDDARDRLRDIPSPQKRFSLFKLAGLIKNGPVQARMKPQTGSRPQFLYGFDLSL